MHTVLSERNQKNEQRRPLEMTTNRWNDIVEKEPVDGGFKANEKWREVTTVTTTHDTHVEDGNRGTNVTGTSGQTSADNEVRKTPTMDEDGRIGKMVFQVRWKKI